MRFTFFRYPDGFAPATMARLADRALLILGLVTAALLFGLPKQTFAQGLPGMISLALLGIACVAVAIVFWRLPLAIKPDVDEISRSEFFLGRSRCVAFFGAGVVMCALAVAYVAL